MDFFFFLFLLADKKRRIGVDHDRVIQGQVYQRNPLIYQVEGKGKERKKGNQDGEWGKKG